MEKIAGFVERRIRLLALAVFPLTVFSAEPGMLSLTVSPEVPMTERVAHTPYSRSDSLKIRNDLDSGIKSREFHYAWRWLHTPLHSWFYSGIHEERMLCLSDIGPCGDDGLLFKWTIGRSEGEYAFEVLDSRMLTVVIQKNGLAKMDVMNVFTTLVSYADFTREENVRVASTETGKTRDGASYGYITVDRGDARCWFTEPIGWYKEGDALLLVFDKVLRLPASKTPYTVDAAHFSVDGARWDDKRSYLRFEKSNRVQLAKEYFTNVILPKQPKPTIIDNTELHGMPIDMIKE